MVTVALSVCVLYNDPAFNARYLALVNSTL